MCENCDAGQLSQCIKAIMKPVDTALKDLYWRNAIYIIFASWKNNALKAAFDWLIGAGIEAKEKFELKRTTRDRPAKSSTR